MREVAEPGAGPPSTSSSRCTPTTSRTPPPPRCVWPVPPAPTRSPVSPPVSPSVGPAHGGANEACLQMLEEIGDVSRVGEYIARQGQERSFKLMGFGHRVHKELRPACQADGQGLPTCSANWASRTTVCSSSPGAREDRPGRRILRREEALPERRLLPGIVQKALGIPTEMFTCIFALARTVGWMTQWEEMITDPEYKIGRPRQLYRRRRPSRRRAAGAQRG